MSAAPAPLSEFAQKRAKQAVLWSKESDTYLKYVCAAAFYAGVGDYSHVTKFIADERGRSKSTVENWSQAFKLYNVLRRENMKYARRLWRKLDASKWWLAWEIHVKGYSALHYLLMAESHNMSGRDMMAEFRADLDAHNAPMQISRAVIAFRGLADELLKSNSCNDEQIDALMRVQEVFK